MAVNHEDLQASVPRPDKLPEQRKIDRMLRRWPFASLPGEREQLHFWFGVCLQEEKDRVDQVDLYLPDAGSLDDLQALRDDLQSIESAAAAEAKIDAEAKYEFDRQQTFRRQSRDAKIQIASDKVKKMDHAITVLKGLSPQWVKRHSDAIHMDLQGLRDMCNRAKNQISFFKGVIAIEIPAGFKPIPGVRDHNGNEYYRMIITDRHPMFFQEVRNFNVDISDLPVNEDQDLVEFFENLPATQLMLADRIPALEKEAAELEQSIASGEAHSDRVLHHYLPIGITKK